MNRLDGNYLDLENSCMKAKVPLFADIVAERRWDFKDRVAWTLNWCQRYPDDTFVFIDPWDTLCVGEPDRIEALANEQEILFPADKNVDRGTWPVRGLEEKYEERRVELTPWNHLNGAGPAGRGRYIREAIKWGLVEYQFLNPTCNDAAFWLYVYLYGGFGELDQQCNLTHQLYWGKDGDLTYNNKGQVFNTVTGSSPQFIHSSGHTWERIPKELIPPRRDKRV